MVAFFQVSYAKLEAYNLWQSGCNDLKLAHLASFKCKFDSNWHVGIQAHPVCDSYIHCVLLYSLCHPRLLTFMHNLNHCEMCLLSETWIYLKCIGGFLWSDMSKKWSVFVCPIGGTLPPPCCPLSSLFSHVPITLSMYSGNKTCLASILKVLSISFLVSRSTHFCVFVSLFYIFASPLSVSLSVCKNSRGKRPACCSALHVSQNIITRSSTITVKLVLLHWLTDSSWRFQNNLIKSAASPREKSHKSKWHPSLFFSFHCISTYREGFLFSALTFNFLWALFLPFSLFRFHFSWFWCKALCFPLLSAPTVSWFRISQQLFQFRGCFLWHNHQWFAGIFIPCASPPAVTALTERRDKKKEGWHFQQRDMVCVGF